MFNQAQDPYPSSSWQARRVGRFRPPAGQDANYLVPIHKWLICPISLLPEKFNPRNINHMSPVKFFGRRDLDQIILFVDGHYLIYLVGYQDASPMVPLINAIALALQF